MTIYAHFQGLGFLFSNSQFTRLCESLCNCVNIYLSLHFQITTIKYSNLPVKSEFTHVRWNKTHMQTNRHMHTDSHTQRTGVDAGTSWNRGFVLTAVRCTCVALIPTHSPSYLIYSCSCEVQDIFCSSVHLTACLSIHVVWTYWKKPQATA